MAQKKRMSEDDINGVYGDLGKDLDLTEDLEEEDFD